VSGHLSVAAGAQGKPDKQKKRACPWPSGRTTWRKAAINDSLSKLFLCFHPMILAQHGSDEKKSSWLI
jgi:hypothetical protein